MSLMASALQMIAVVVVIPVPTRSKSMVEHAKHGSGRPAVLSFCIARPSNPLNGYAHVVARVHVD
jgi:hypothetical protein